jgi:hypothetical protein
VARARPAVTRFGVHFTAAALLLAVPLGQCVLDTASDFANYAGTCFTGAKTEIAVANIAFCRRDCIANAACTAYQTSNNTDCYHSLEASAATAPCAGNWVSILRPHELSVTRIAITYEKLSVRMRLFNSLSFHERVRDFFMLLLIYDRVQLFTFAFFSYMNVCIGCDDRVASTGWL